MFKPELGFFKKIKDSVKGLYKDEGLMDELCEYLQKIGINSNLLDRGSPEAIGPRWKKGPFSSGFVLGCVKVEDQNLDLIQVERMSAGGEDSQGWLEYFYHYVVKAGVEDLEENLKTDVKKIKKGFLRKEIVDFKWEGRELSQSLNSDPELRNMMLKQGLNRLRSIEVRYDKKNQCVRITQLPRMTAHVRVNPLIEIPTIGKEFPTIEDFEIYNRIAQHIRNIIDQSDR